MDGVERRQLTAQGTHGAIVSNIFHCKRPRFTSTAYSAACERVIMIMRENYFLDFVGGGLATSVFEQQHKLDASVAHVGLLSTVQIFAHSGAEVHRLSAHHAQAS
jgi:hypothetical protein